MTTQFSVAAALIHAEKLAAINAARPLQIEWLDKIAAATQQLRPQVNDTPVLDQVEAAIDFLRHQLGSPEASNDDISREWLPIIIGLLTEALGMDDRTDTGDLVGIFAQLVASCAAA
ncbi:MAG TPA: hypothetical protein VJN94_14340 [Candidatus Binataceae bacterium]|nr:hypothetical protein [Candidatus Binataceae bacterium]